MALLRAAHHVVLLTTAHFCLMLLLGTGVLVPPVQTSLLPPSVCIAPQEVYEQIAVMTFLYSPAAVGSIATTGFIASHHQAAAAGSGAGATTKAFLRAITLTAVALSATAAGLAMTAAYLILQVKAGKLSCLSSTVRVAVYGSYVVIGPVLLLAYGDAARMAISVE